MNTDLTNAQSINQIADDFMYAYASAILDTGHNASGELIMNMTKLLQYDGRYFTFSINMPIQGIFLEYGTKPHFPPVNAILKWIKIKPVLPTKPMKNGKLPTQQQLAYMISRKISVDGTKPTNLLSNTKSDFQITSKLITELTKLLTDNNLDKYYK